MITTRHSSLPEKCRQCPHWRNERGYIPPVRALAALRIGLALAACLCASFASTAAAAEPAAVERPAAAAATKPISLKLTDATPQAAFAELSKVSGIAIDPEQPGLWDQVSSHRVTLSLENQPFWTIFLEICRKAEVYPRLFQQGRNIVLSTSSVNQLKCPTQITGPCMIVLKSINHTVSLDPGGAQPATHSAHVQLNLFVEPTLPVLSIPYNVTLEEAIDEAGHPLNAPNMRFFGPGNSVNSCLVQLNAQLACPENVGQRIARLKGYATVMLRGKMDSIEINDPLNARQVNKKAGGMPVIFEQLENPGAGSFIARFTVQADPADRAVMQRFGNHMQTVRLLDAKGNEYPTRGGGTGTGPGVFHFQTHFMQSGNLGPPAKVVLTVPAELAELPVPFQFEDLPLP